MYITLFEKFQRKKTKRKIGSFTKHCYNIGYKNGSNGDKCNRSSGKRKIGSFKEMEYDKDYFYDLVDGEYKIPKNF